MSNTLPYSIKDPAAIKAIKNGIFEASASKTRIEAERDLIKEIVKKIHEDHGIPKKTISKMIALYHKQSFQQEVEEHEELRVLYTNALENKTE